jgi:hypothetical protein
MRSTDINALIVIRALFQAEEGEHVGDLKIKEINPSRLFRLPSPVLNSHALLKPFAA